MKFSKVSAALGVAIISTSIPVLASAAPASVGPIKINSVYTMQANGYSDTYNFPGRVDVSFTNTNSVPATDIVFNIENRNGAILHQFEDVGTFAPGVAVQHNFSDNVLNRNQQVVVQAAAFADGSKWSNTDTTSMRARRQATMVGMLDKSDFPFLHN
jgi:hypothetical protein